MSSEVPIRVARLSLVLGALFLVLSAFFLTTNALAQNNFGFVNNITQVPVPGVGHDYLHDLSEIVNPANGSLSVRIEAPRPKERGLNYPFYAFMYDSTQQFNLQYLEGTSGPYACGNDSAGDGANGNAPQPLTCILSVSFLYQSILQTAGRNGVLSGPNSMVSNNAEYSRWIGGASYMTCSLSQQGISYEDPYGVIHDMGAYAISNSGGCSYLGIQDNPVGGDEEYKIVLPDTYSGIGNGYMIDLHGNSVGSVPSLILEDVNGNAVNGTGRTGSYQSFQPWGDAFAQTASRTFAGGATYNYTWGTATTQFSPSFVDETKIQLGYDKLCVAPKLNTSGNPNSVVVQMKEPDGLYYKFYYDATYGFLNKIIYPTGAYVQYTWGVNPMSDATGWTTPGQSVNNYNDPVQEPSGAGGINTSCVFVHDTPAVVKRVVSYDGVHPAMEQDFSYCTVWQGSSTCATDQNGAAQTGTSSWTSKQTIVTTKDLLSTGTPSFKTIYTYSPYTPYLSIGNHLLSSPIPVENTIVYQDTAGNVLRTVTKAWKLGDRRNVS